MIGAILLFAALPYQELLGLAEVPHFEGGARYEYYAHETVDASRVVVVYGFVPEKQGSARDVDHRVFVALITNGAVASRRDVTASVFNIGVLGRFAEFRARVTSFRLRGFPFVDVELWSRITGDVSASSDVIFRITPDDALVLATKLEDTAEFSRKGNREIHETTSEVAVAGDALVWTRRERLAARSDEKKAFRVNCQTTKKTYRPRLHGLAVSTRAAKGKPQALRRINTTSVLPCCSGCQFAEP